MPRILTAICLVFAALGAPRACLAAGDEIDNLLARSEPPEGVVFEIVEEDDDALSRILPVLQDQVRRLRERFPGIDIAVVTHGREQFALQTRYREEEAGVHAAVKSLVRDESVAVHVCETHAGWYGVSAAEFPDYVDVAPAGPVQIRNYEELGFEPVRLEVPDE